jgi:hypothetical protein
MNEHRSFLEWHWQGKANIVGEKPFADRLSRNWTRALAVRGRWQAAWSMAQPAKFSVYQSRNACEIISDIRRDFLLSLKYRRWNKRIFCSVGQQYPRQILILLCVALISEKHTVPIFRSDGSRVSERQAVTTNHGSGKGIMPFSWNREGDRELWETDPRVNAWNSGHPQMTSLSGHQSN